MESKDTVMSLKEVDGVLYSTPLPARPLYSVLEPFLQAQAELSFRAGMAECAKTHKDIREASYAPTFREVVKQLDMIDEEAYDTKDFTRRVCDLLREIRNGAHPPLVNP